MRGSISILKRVVVDDETKEHILALWQDSKNQMEKILEQGYVHDFVYLTNNESFENIPKYSFLIYQKFYLNMLIFQYQKMLDLLQG